MKYELKADDGFAFTAPVGRFEPNRWGLYDMHGNAFEWCQDYYDPGYYQHAPPSDPVGPEKGTIRVLRGGGWLDNGRSSRSANRGQFMPVFRNGVVGFRVARAPSP